MSDLELGSAPTATAEDYITQAARFMTTWRLQGVFVEGDLQDDRSYEGIAFRGPDGNEVGEVRFADGVPLATDIDEVQRRLATPQLITEVIRPIQRAVASVYAEGSDLLDERFNALPGMN